VRPRGPSTTVRTTVRTTAARAGAVRAGAVLAGLLLLSACGRATAGAAPDPAPSSAPSPPSASSPPATAAALPRPAHTVVVVMENHGFDDVVDSPKAPWLNGLPAAVLTDWHGVAHPSQPNYLGLFTGSTHGVTDDHCPVRVPGPTLGSQLQTAGATFTGYSEGLPAAGSTVCRVGDYARKHNPWVDSTRLPAAVNQPLTALPTDFAALPTVAFVIPDLCHDTHDCHTVEGDRWLRDTLGPYVAWARTHDSLLVVTYDEQEGHGASNHIPTFLVGPMVAPGRYAVRGDHYTMLRTLEALNGLPGIGAAADREPLTQIWR
jgi:hypothetical protein